jgi:hypothetical protein
MANNKYSKLQLDKSKVENVIRNWCDQELADPYTLKKTENAQQIAYTVTCGDNSFMIILYKGAGDTYTISPNTGKDKVTSAIVAEYIYSQLCSELVKSPYANGFSMKMPYDDFTILIQLLEENDDISFETTSNVSEPGRAQYKMYRLRSTKQDTVVIKYYTGTGRIQVQGKPLYLFNEILSLICDTGENAEALVDAHIQLCDLTVNRADLDDDLLNILGTGLYNFLTVSQRAMISSSLVLSRVTINGLNDYSYIIMQSLKAFEGFLEKLLVQDGFSMNANKNGTKRHHVGDFFEKKGVDFVFKTAYISTPKSVNRSVLEKTYTFFNMNRHPFMHARGDDVTTVVISSFDEAKVRLDELLKEMKKRFQEFVI